MNALQIEAYIVSENWERHPSDRFSVQHSSSMTDESLVERNLLETRGKLVKRG